MRDNVTTILQFQLFAYKTVMLTQRVDEVQEGDIFIQALYWTISLTVIILSSSFNCKLNENINGIIQ